MERRATTALQWTVIVREPSWLLVNGLAVMVVVPAPLAVTTRVVWSTTATSLLRVDQSKLSSMRWRC